MRHLALLTLAVLATFPLCARDHGWREPRRVIVVQESCRPSHRWDGDGWRLREHDRGWHGRHDRCDRYEDRWDDRVVLGPVCAPRPLLPPISGRIELWLH